MARWNLPLANTLFLYKKTENASACCEWRSVPARGSDMQGRMLQMGLDSFGMF